jgi:exopolyphosphatase / guanosine-5'-triphosphate,3'-diphosphate pyrophosphatase
MHAPRRLALIDMGTNTFHLLIAALEAGWPPHVLLRTRTVVKLGEGGISEGRIAEAAQARALKALRAYREEIDLHGVGEHDIRAVATSAVRSAANGAAFLAEVFAQTGIRVEVIPGGQEAELIWAGVREAVPLGTDAPSLLMDIGGGSVEFIIADQAQIYWKQSFEIGAQRLLDRFFWRDPISAAEMAAEEDFLAEALAPLTQAVAQWRPTVLVGASGSFDTFCDLEAARRAEPRDLHNPPPESELTLAAFAHHFGLLKRLDHNGRVALPGMTPMRADMIVVAGVLIDWCLRTYGLTRIRVSAWALKEGLLARAAAGAAPTAPAD